MALPQLNTATYELTIPSSKQKIEYRPFLVKEEKVLLMAMETGNAMDVQRAVRNLITACTFDKLDVQTLTSFDLDYMFLQLRARSIGENIKLNIKCDECGERTPVKINVDDIKPSEFDESKGFKYQLTNDIGVIMRFPRMMDIQRFEKERDPDDMTVADAFISLMAASIESIYDADTVYPAEDHSVQELVDFVENLKKDQYDIVNKFFEAVPKIATDLEFKCDKCGHDNHTHLEGLKDFFG